MKKTILIFTLAFSFLIAKAQLNPVSHVTYGDIYGYPSYPNCPTYNCIKLIWSAPAASVTDTLVGYNIYQNDIFYKFVTDTFYGCPYVNVCDTSAHRWFNGGSSFWVTVKAVYNTSPVAYSIANDSAYVGGALTDINKQNDKKNTTIAPNPFSYQTTLYLDNILQNGTLTIYNSLGQQVKQIKNISGQTIALQRDNLLSGVYFMYLTENDKILTTGKFIITNN